MITAIASYSISTTGESADVTFSADGGEHSIRIPFELIGDLQAALVHIRAALIEKRRALGSGEESAGMLAVKSLKVRDLPNGDLHLHVSTAEKVPFHFHLQRPFAAALSQALKEWLDKTAR